MSARMERARTALADLFTYQRNPLSYSWKTRSPRAWFKIALGVVAGVGAGLTAGYLLRHYGVLNIRLRWLPLSQLVIGGVGGGLIGGAITATLLQVRSAYRKYRREARQLQGSSSLQDWINTDT